MGKISTKFVGRIILSAENSRIQFTIGRYGNLPYIGIWSIETGSTKFVGRISLSAKSLGKPFHHRQVWIPALRRLWENNSSL